MRRLREELVEHGVELLFVHRFTRTAQRASHALSHLLMCRSEDGTVVGFEQELSGFRHLLCGRRTGCQKCGDHLSPFRARPEERSAKTRAVLVDGNNELKHPRWMRNRL